MKHRLASVLILVVFYASLAACWLRADVKMPAIFGDHMVLQQEATLPVWGWAAPGESVTVTVGGESASATAAADGTWMVKLPPLPNGSPATTMTVKGKNTLTFSDVLVGDVWICSGQSNMEYGVGNSVNCPNTAGMMAKADNPQIRLFMVLKTPSLKPLNDCTGQWVLCSPAALRVGGWKGFSEIGYLFTRELQSSLHRPIGMIESAWGGTPAQAWTSLSGLQKDPALQEYVDTYNKDLAAYPKLDPEGYPSKMAAYLDGMTKWNQELPPYQKALKAWDADAAKAKAAGQPEPPNKPVAPIRPVPPRDPTGGGGGSANLFNGMIAPLIPFAIKGVIWYQGEANEWEGELYRTLFGRMITDWREKWGQGNFPFLFVQLASLNCGPQPNWAFVREAQFKTLALPNTGMATAIDLGDYKYPKNIHPPDKLDVALRLALAARHVAYGQDIVYSGPVYASEKVEGNAIRVSFTQTGGGLVIGRPPWIDPAAPAWPADKLTGFEIAGADGNYVPADAKIDGNTVVVSSPQVAQPVFVRYAWSNFVVTNLYNKEGLPAVPFRTDDQSEASQLASNPPPAKTPAPGTAKK